MLTKRYYTASAAATIALILILFGTGVNGQDECKGLLPECTHASVYKCGNAEPVCGGDNVRQQRDNCASVLVVCTPTGSSLVFNDASSNSTNATDGDSEAGGDWDWVGFDSFNDACNKIGLELPFCDGPSYKCGGSEAVCGELEEWMTCSGNLVVCGGELSVVSSTTTSTTVTLVETTTEESSSSTTTNGGSSSTTTTTSTTTTSSAPGMTMGTRGILTEVTISVCVCLLFMV